MKNIFTYSTAFVLGLALVASPEADAQQFSKRKQYNSVGFSLNAMNYFGDVTPVTNFSSFRFGFRHGPDGIQQEMPPLKMSRRRRSMNSPMRATLSRDLPKTQTLAAGRVNINQNRLTLTRTLSRWGHRGKEIQPPATATTKMTRLQNDLNSISC